jgi:hypothetical protein
MIKRLLISATALALLMGASAMASGEFGWNPEKGKKLFVSKLKKKCKISITKFTQAHTQKEWKAIIANGQFEEEFKKVCPPYESGKLTPKQVADLGDCAVNYASDSYNIPS